MPTASCAGVQFSVGLPATAGGAVSRAAASGFVLSTEMAIAGVFSTLPALSVITRRRKIGPSAGWLLPVAVFQLTAKPLPALLPGMLPLPQPPTPVVERCQRTVRRPAVASTASVVSVVVPPTTAPAAGVRIEPSGAVLSTITTTAAETAVLLDASVATLQSR